MAFSGVRKLMKTISVLSLEFAERNLKRVAVYHASRGFVKEWSGLVVCQIWGKFFQRLEVAATRALNLPFGRFQPRVVPVLNSVKDGLSVLVGAGLCLHLHLLPN
jgi:hypothetical protein